MSLFRLILKINSQIKKHLCDDDAVFNKLKISFFLKTFNLFI